MSDKEETVPPEHDHTVKDLSKIGAYSEIGYLNQPNQIMFTIDHLDATKKWHQVPPIIRGNHRKNGELTFGDALEAMKQGYMVRRSNWGREASGIGLNRELENGGKSMNSGLSGHSCEGSREDCEFCAAQREKVRRSYPRGAFFGAANLRYQTIIKELGARDILSEDWEVIGIP